MKAMTITVYYGEGQSPGDVTFGSIVNGGEVTAMAAYDLFETMEIAETALEASSDDICVEAREKVRKAISAMLNTPSKHST